MEISIKRQQIMSYMVEHGLGEHCFFHLPTFLPPQIELSVDSEATPFDDSALVRRIMTEYTKNTTQYDSSDGFWDALTIGCKKPVHEALLSGNLERVTFMLRNPATNYLFYGFDAIYIDGAISARYLADALLNLAVAVGAKRAEYPEAVLTQADTFADKADFDTPLNIDGLLDDIARETGLPIVFPQPFPQEQGFSSKRGLVTNRALQAVYQALRITQIARGNPDFKVLEIGAGLGRTAYYANAFGIRNYTIVDIPMTNVAQSYFLGRVLGEDKVRIGSEAAMPEQEVRILSTVDFADHAEQYDLIVNCDSLTEMPQCIAQGYWKYARRNTRRFWSVNHEYNKFTVRDIYSRDSDVTVERHMYPLRRGYADEMIIW